MNAYGDGSHSEIDLLENKRKRRKRGVEMLDQPMCLAGNLLLFIIDTVKHPG